MSARRRKYSRKKHRKSDLNLRAHLSDASRSRFCLTQTERICNSCVVGGLEIAADPSPREDESAVGGSGGVRTTLIYERLLFYAEIITRQHR